MTTVRLVAAATVWVRPGERPPPRAERRIAFPDRGWSIGRPPAPAGPSGPSGRYGHGDHGASPSGGGCGAGR